MKFILFVAVVFVICSAYGAKGEGFKNKGPKKCDGVEFKQTDDMQKSLTACKTKYLTGDSKLATNDQNNSNMTCFQMCMLQSVGVITQDGKVDKTKISNFIKIVFPTSVQASLITSYINCADEKGSNKMTVTADGKCDSFGPFIKCVGEAEHKACKWDKNS